MSTSDELVACFDGLEMPESVENGFAVRARELPDRPHAWVGKDSRGRPALLLAFDGAVTGASTQVQLNNFAYLPHALCFIATAVADEREAKELAVLRCLSAERDLQVWFLRTAGALLRGVASPPSQASVDGAVDRLVRLFVALGQPAAGAVQGLWGELLLIARAENPTLLLRSWHGDPMEVHDFVSGQMRAEVKTTQGGRREHHFSLEQLAVPDGCRLLVLSMLLQKSSGGLCVADLVDEIEARVTPALLAKIYDVIGETLGADWRRASDLRFSAEAALESLHAYDGAFVPRVPLAMVPPGVRNVRFTVEMWDVPLLPANELPAVELWSAFPKWTGTQR